MQLRYLKLECNTMKTQNSKLKTKKLPTRGFTLIELLIVLSIVGALAAFSTVNLVGARQRARDAERKADLQQLQSALEFYRADNARYPASSPFTSCGSSFSSGGVVYYAKIPCDPQLKTAYTYASTGPSTYTIRACLENGNDPDKDTTDTCSGNTVSFTVRNP